MSNVGTLTVKITGDTSGLESSFNSANRLISGFGRGGGFGAGAVAMGNLISTGLLKVVDIAVDAGKAVVGTLWDSTMMAADLESQLGATAAAWGHTREEIEPIKALINDLGIDPTLKVSATEAAAAIDMLARNGLTMQQVLDGAARAAILLSNSTGGSMEVSATVATDAMSMFKIQATELERVVNGVTAVTIASKYDINDYANALAQGGGVAATSGVSFEDFNGVIAATSAYFASGADAGTSFKVMLTNLTPKSSKAEDAMAALGILTVDYAAASERLSSILGTKVEPTIQDIQKAWVQYTKTQGVVFKNQKEADKVWSGFLKGFERNMFYDTNGQLRDMAEIVGVLNTALSGLSEEDKTKYVHEIFGTDAMRTVMALAGYTEEEFAMLLETMSETDAAEAASTRMNNLSGDMEIFSGVLESVRIQIGDKFQPALRSIYQSATSLLSDLAPYIVGFVGQLASGLEVAIPIVEAKIKDMVSTMNTAFGAAGGGLSGTITGMMAGLGSLTGATFSAEADVVTVNWGEDEFTYTYDANASVYEVSWNQGEFEGWYDAGAQVVGIDWETKTGKESFVYDSEAGITNVRFEDAEGLSYVYDAQAGITKVYWNNVGFDYQHTYNTNTDIYAVNWGGDKFNLGYTYDAKADVSKFTINGKTPAEAINEMSSSLAGWLDQKAIDWKLTPTVTGKLGWDDAFAFSLDWLPLIIAPLPWASAFAFTLEWAPTIAEMLGWGTVFDFTLIDWMPAIGTQLTWANVFAFVLSGWAPAIGTPLGWGSVFLFSLSGWAPSIGKTFSWDDVFSFSLDWWPTIHWPPPPAWWTAIFGGGDSGSSTNNTAPAGSNSSSNSTPGGAVGRMNWQGGDLDVGEAGRERIYLPRGTRILNAQETQRDNQGGDVTINLNYYGGSDIERRKLLDELVEELDRRR